MDDRRGDLYKNRDAALSAGVPSEHIVELRGSKRSITRVARAVRRQAELNARRKTKKARQQERASRKANRD